MSDGLPFICEALDYFERSAEECEDENDKRRLKITAKILRNYLNKVDPPLDDREVSSHSDRWESLNYCCKDE